MTAPKPKERPPVPLTEEISAALDAFAYDVQLARKRFQTGLAERQYKFWSDLDSITVRNENQDHFERCKERLLGDVKAATTLRFDQCIQHALSQQPKKLQPGAVVEWVKERFKSILHTSSDVGTLCSTPGFELLDNVPPPGIGGSTKALANDMRESLDAHLEQVARNARLRLALSPPDAAQPKPTGPELADEKAQGPRDIDQRKTKIARIKAAKRGISARAVCEEMDAVIEHATTQRMREEYAPLQEWIDATDGKKRTWVELYDDRNTEGRYSRVHNRVKTLIAKVPPLQPEVTKKLSLA